MSWNGSDINGAKSSHIRPVGKKNVLFKWIISIAFLILILIGLYLGWVFSSATDDVIIDKNSPSVTNTASISISKASPISSNLCSTVAIKPKTNSLSRAWQRYYDGRDTNKWTVVYNPKTKKEYLSRIVNPGSKNRKPSLYQARALNVLDTIVLKPISSPLPGVRIDESFIRSLQAGLEEKISINNDDDPEVAARKESMIEMQKELRLRMAKGENLKDLLTDALHQYNNVAVLRRMMQTERAVMRQNGESDEAISAFTKACNERLLSQGATPLLQRSDLVRRIEDSLNKKGTNK